MAKFLSHIVTGASGSVGDTTYSRNRNGLYFKKKSIPTQPRTVAQRQVRAAFAAASQAWRTLTEEQRAGWHALGAQMTTTDSLGQTSTLTGAQAHLALNGVLSTTGATTPITDAPSQPDMVGALPSVTLAATRSGGSEGAFGLALQSAIYSGSVQVFATPAVSAGRDYFSTNAFRLLEVVNGLSAGTTSLTAAYTSRYGTPSVGTKIAVRLVPISANGFKGTASVSTDIVSIGS